MIVTLIYMYKYLKEKITFRDAVTGTLIYIFTSVFIHQIAYSLLLEKMGSENLILRNLILSLIDGIGLVLVYLLICRFFYHKKVDSIIAYSLAFGQTCIQTIFSCVYSLLCYASMMGATADGSITKVLKQQDISKDLIPSIIQQINSFSYSSILLIVMQFLTIIATQFLVACLLYHFIEKKNYKILLSAFTVSILFAISIQFVGGLNVVFGIILSFLLLLASLYYVFCVKDNLVLQVYNQEDEKEVIIRKTKKRKK